MKIEINELRNFLISPETNVILSNGNCEALSDTDKKVKKVSNLKILNDLNKEIKENLGLFSEEDKVRIRNYIASFPLPKESQIKIWQLIVNFFSRLQNKFNCLQFLTSREMATQILHNLTLKNQNISKKDNEGEKEKEKDPICGRETVNPKTFLKCNAYKPSSIVLERYNALPDFLKNDPRVKIIETKKNETFRRNYADLCNADLKDDEVRIFVVLCRANCTHADYKLNIRLFFNVKDTIQGDILYSPPKEMMNVRIIPGKHTMYITPQTHKSLSKMLSGEISQENPKAVHFGAWDTLEPANFESLNAILEAVISRESTFYNNKKMHFHRFSVD